MKALTEDKAKFASSGAAEEEEEVAHAAPLRGHESFDDLVSIIRGEEPDYTWMLCTMVD